MTSQDPPALHPSLLRTSAALQAIGARQQSQAFPTIAQSLVALALSVAAVAAVVLA